MKNLVILIGNLGTDPEKVTFDNGNSITKAPVATTEYWKDKSTGEKKEKTQWHNLVFNGKLSEIAEKYLKKGSKIFITGSIDYSKYTKDGKDVYFTQIKVNELKMLDSKPQGTPQAQAASNNQNDNDSDLPF